LELGEEGDPAGAAAQFAEAVRLKPEFIEARLNLGIALSGQHLDQRALEQFEEVLRRDPKNQIAQARAKLLHANLPATPQAH
jgi:tetratricopeptide (TPR) repeat protein